MTGSTEQQLADWAAAVLEEVLVGAAKHVHERDAPTAPLDVSVTFQVAAMREDGCLTVRSPGNRGRTIHVSVPVLPTP